MPDNPAQIETVKPIATQLDELEQRMSNRLDQIQLYIDKTLHLTSIAHDAMQRMQGRQYFPLNDKWGLSHLDDGSPFFVNSEDRNITPWILMGGIWEPNITRVLMAYTQPGMRIFDIGANMGYFTVKLGKRVGEHGQVHAFDPNPEVADVCLENVKINSLSSTVSLHRLALGDKAGRATLTRSKSNMASANLMGDQDADVAFEVDVATLDELFPTESDFQLMKLDAEGYEVPILTGGARLIERSPDLAVMAEVGLERWERHAPLSSLFNIAGPDKAAYVVRDDGTITRHWTAEQARAHLLGQPYHEAYYFLGRPDTVERLLGGLVT